MQYDVLILGGGPSGLSAALHLANRTARDFQPSILIIEKEHYPRPKLCAGGLTADAERILANLGLNVDEVPHVKVSRAHFDFAGSGLNVGMKDSYALRVIRRDEFDAWLAKKAASRGIEIRQGVAVKDIAVDKDGVTVKTSAGDFRAKVIVGADGSNGITRARIFPNAPTHTARVLEVVVDVIASREAAKQSPSAGRLLRRENRPPRNPARNRRGNDSHAYFDFFPVPHNIAGYTWDFPTQVNGQPARCWGIYDANLPASGKRPALKEILADEMSRRGFDLKDCEIKGHPIRWYHPENPVSAPRVILVGDAAGADSIFGEGISIALGHGFVAAQEIEAAFRKGDFSFNGYWFRFAKSGLGQTLFVRWLLTNIVYTLKWAWLQFLLWRILQPIVLLVAWIFILNWSKRLK